MYTDINQVNRMFPGSAAGLGIRPNPGGPGAMYSGQAQYLGLGNGSDGKMPCALTFTGKN